MKEERFRRRRSFKCDAWVEEMAMGIDYYSYPPHVSRSEYIFLIMETLMVNISLMLLCPYDVMPFSKKEKSFKYFN